MSEEYAGRQIVGIDLHRHRSVLVRMTEAGQRLETVRISNEPEYLRAVMARAGESPEVVLEACYGWYWATDTLGELGAKVHLAHPLGVKGFAYRRVKNDERDAADLADLLRMGRLPESWIAPPASRELRELVRHRAKLVGLRTNLRCRVHAVLAGAGVHVVVSDLFGTSGRQLLERVGLAPAMRAKVNSCLRLIDVIDFEIDTFARLVAGRLRADPGYIAVQTIPGVGPILAAVFARRDRRRGPLPRPRAAGQLGRIDPAAPRVRHHRPPRPYHQTRQPAGALGRHRGRATRRRPHPHRCFPRPDRRTPRTQPSQGRRRPRAPRVRLLRAA